MGTSTPQLLIYYPVNIAEKEAEKVSEPGYQGIWYGWVSYRNSYINNDTVNKLTTMEMGGGEWEETTISDN